MEQLYFIEESHSYHGVESGLQYTPVSTVAKCILPPVDWEAIKVRKAKKMGITTQELQDDWTMRAKLGTEAGTAIHNQKEREILSSFFVDRYGELFEPVPYTVVGDKKYQIQELKPSKVYPELITSINRGRVRVGGTSDIVYITKDNYVHIEDWKTDHAIEYQGFRNQTLAEPLSHRQDCNFDIYSLKMGCYMFFILQANPHLKPGKITLRHLPIEREDKIPVLTNGLPTVLNEWEIPIKYEDNEADVKAMLNHYAKTL